MGFHAFIVSRNVRLALRRCRGETCVVHGTGERRNDRTGQVTRRCRAALPRVRHRTRRVHNLSMVHRETVQPQRFAQIGVVVVRQRQKDTNEQENYAGNVVIHNEQRRVRRAVGHLHRTVRLRQPHHAHRREGVRPDVDPRTRA